MGKNGKRKKNADNGNDALPKGFDIDEPKLPEAIENAALGSGGYPYKEKLGRKEYEHELTQLQIELLKLQAHVQKARRARRSRCSRAATTAGKGGCIGRFMQHLNPRHARTVALSKPTTTEQGQWYFQRYVAHLPTRATSCSIDRSWYNRAGVERVMGFCTPEQSAQFLREAPEFEAMLMRDGIRLFKLYLSIGREMQFKRFHERRHDPLKRWKLTDMDIAAMQKWDEYSEAQQDLFRFTHTKDCPWTVIRANDERRAA